MKALIKKAHDSGLWLHYRNATSPSLLLFSPGELLAEIETENSEDFLRPGSWELVSPEEYMHTLKNRLDAIQNEILALLARIAKEKNSMF